MFSNLFLKVFERMLGRKFAAAAADESGGIVTERTLRNWLQKRTAPDVEKLAALRDHGRNALIGLFANKGWPAARRDAALALLDTDPGLATICSPTNCRKCGTWRHGWTLPDRQARRAAS